MTIRGSFNAPRPEDVGAFWQRMTSRGGGIAKPSRFLVQIAPPRFPDSRNLRFPEARLRLRDLTFQCESAELPGRTISTSDVQIAGPSFKQPYGTQYSDITLTFLCTNDMYEKKIFDDWLNYINNTDNFTFAYRDEYATTINIFQYDEGGDSSPWPAVTYGAQLIDAWPIGINQMSLAWGEDSVHRLGITFAYTYYKPISGINAPIPIPIGPYQSITGALGSATRSVQNAVFGIQGAITGLGGFLGSFFS
jgi:hypothetical protein